MSGAKNIVLVAPPMEGSNVRETLAGFHAAAVARGWIVDVVDMQYAVEDWLPSWDIDAIAIIVRGYHKLTEAVRQKVVAAASFEPEPPGVSRVIVDDAAIGRVAAEHFAGNGLRAVGALRYGTPKFACRRFTAFGTRAEELGVRYIGEFDQLQSAKSLPRERSWEPICQWIADSPKPFGLFCGCDRWGRLAALGLRLLGVRIPEEVALLGVDDDELECELTWPPLSSAAVPWEQMGRITAELVERRFRGEPALTQPVVLAPSQVVVRRSSDILAVTDLQVSQALAYIRRNATRGPVRVADILKQVPTHRARLHRAFRKELGRTIMDEVHRVRVEHAKRLLASSGMTVDQVAARSGFANYRKLSAAFKTEVGATSSSDRKKFKA